VKKPILLFLAGMLISCCLCACSGTASREQETHQLKIVTTIFPEYDWVREVLGETAGDVQLTMLLDSGVDLHNYQPTASDIRKISSCDLFLYVGGESDSWVADALQEATNSEMHVLNLLELLGDQAKEEEILEGMEEEETSHTDTSEQEDIEMDEHIWLSLKNTQLFVTAIAQELADINGENAQIYQANAAAYIESLAALDQQYQEMVDAASVKTLLFGDRFPFRYLVDDYGLSYYAAFVGCSAETEASFETITFLSGKVDELGLHTVMTVEASDQKIAQTIVSNTATKDQQILSLDSMQSATSKDIENGVTYLSVMEKNLAVLADALQ
jgi:zinc transport system substrate-binding protein